MPTHLKRSRISQLYHQSETKNYFSKQAEILDILMPVIKDPRHLKHFENSECYVLPFPLIPGFVSLIPSSAAWRDKSTWEYHLAKFFLNHCANCLPFLGFLHRAEMQANKMSCFNHPFLKE